MNKKELMENKRSQIPFLGGFPLIEALLAIPCT
jgi:hypothetical protein